MGTKGVTTRQPNPAGCNDLMTHKSRCLKVFVKLVPGVDLLMIYQFTTAYRVKQTETGRCVCVSAPKSTAWWSRTRWSKATGARLVLVLRGRMRTRSTGAGFRVACLARRPAVLVISSLRAVRLAGLPADGRQGHAPRGWAWMGCRARWRRARPAAGAAVRRALACASEVACCVPFAPFYSRTRGWHSFGTGWRKDLTCNKSLINVVF